MKKKILILVAVVTLVALCSLTFVACTPTSVGAYLKALNKSDCATIEMMFDEKGENPSIVLAFNGDNMYVNVNMGVIAGKVEAYIISKGDSKLLYSCVADKWTKTDVATEIEAMTKQYDMKKILAEIDADEKNYDVKDGVWTEKASGNIFKIESGKLVGYEKKGDKEVKIMTINVSKPSFKLPDGAKALDK